MKFLIRSMQDSETGEDNYENLKVKDFSSTAKAVEYVKKEYGKEAELFELRKINIYFRKEK